MLDGKKYSKTSPHKNDLSIIFKCFIFILITVFVCASIQWNHYMGFTLIACAINKCSLWSTITLPAVDIKLMAYTFNFMDWYRRIYKLAHLHDWCKYLFPLFLKVLRLFSRGIMLKAGLGCLPFYWIIEISIIIETYTTDLLQYTANFWAVYWTMFMHIEFYLRNIVLPTRWSVTYCTV